MLSAISINAIQEALKANGLPPCGTKEQMLQRLLGNKKEPSSKNESGAKRFKGNVPEEVTSAQTSSVRSIRTPIKAVYLYENDQCGDDEDNDLEKAFASMCVNELDVEPAEQQIVREIVDFEEAKATYVKGVLYDKSSLIAIEEAANDSLPRLFEDTNLEVIYRCIRGEKMDKTALPPDDNEGDDLEKLFALISVNELDDDIERA